MTAPLTNKTLNMGGTITDKPLGSQSITFAQDTNTFAENVGPFSNPFSVINKTANTGSMTNKTIS